MQNIYDEVNSLDERCRIKYNLNEDILMENASLSMMHYINKRYKKTKKVLIVCGPSNNGADGLALARLLYKKYKINVCLPFQVKSNMAKLQLKRCVSLNIQVSKKIKDKDYDVVVDCLFGSGLNRDLDSTSISIINKLNKLKAFKIACDIPSGINILGQVSKNAFYSDMTITMGALKKSLFTDIAKEYVGKIKVSNLGIQRKIYEIKSNYFLLEKKDLKLPTRDNKISNKGTYGHLSVVIGEKSGAGILCAKAGFAFGCGLITGIIENTNFIPSYIMKSNTVPFNTTALCIGMGLGSKYDKNILNNSISKVIDADLCYDKTILSLLKQENIVLTPHPKEFCSLLKLTGMANISVKELQNNRFKYVSIFSKKYPSIVLLLKGTNVLISQNEKIYVNTLGSSILSKGGSGDVLSGLIGSLLAQGYNSLNAAIQGSLAHTIAALNFKKNNYSLTPKALIKEIKKL